LARRLIEELRRGLNRAYVTRNENLSVLRGKILIGTHLRINAVHPENFREVYLFRGLGKNLVAIRGCLARDSPHGSVVTEDGGRMEQDLVGFSGLREA
jgi:hypothetical protein